METKLKAERPRRPIGVSLLAILYWLAALMLGVIGPISLVYQLTNRSAARSDIIAVGIIFWFVILAILLAFLGLGLWLLKSAAYKITIFFNTLVSLWMVIFWPKTITTVTIILCCSFTSLYLLIPKVRAIFAIGQANTPPSTN